MISQLPQCRAVTIQESTPCRVSCLLGPMIDLLQIQGIFYFDLCFSFMYDDLDVLYMYCYETLQYTSYWVIRSIHNQRFKAWHWVRILVNIGFAPNRYALVVYHIRNCDQYVIKILQEILKCWICVFAWEFRCIDKYSLQNTELPLWTIQLKFFLFTRIRRTII